MNWVLGNQFVLIVVLVCLATIPIEIGYWFFTKKSMYKFVALRGYATLRRVSSRLLIEALAIIGVLAIILVISIKVSPSIDAELKTRLGYQGNFSEGLLFNFIAACATVFALYNTVQILRQVTSDIHNFQNLLASINSELDKIANCPDALAMVMRPFFYMYVKTPSFGHISGENPDSSGSSYQMFNGLLKQAVVKRHVTVRIVCLEPNKFEEFHKGLTSDPSRLTKLTDEAKEVCTFLQTQDPTSLKPQPAISNNFLIVTPNRAWQFIIKPVPGNGRHDVSGREIKKSEDIRFAKESIDQYWI